MAPTRLLIAVIAAIVTPLLGCKSESEQRLEKATEYSRRIAESGVLEPAWEKIDLALAKGDASALRKLVAETVYDLGIPLSQFPTFTADQLITQQLDLLRKCDLVGKSEHLFSIQGAFGSVGAKNAMFSEGPTFDREKVLPEEGMWLFLGSDAGVETALARCGAGSARMRAIVLAPVGGTWKLVGIDAFRTTDADASP